MTRPTDAATRPATTLFICTTCRLLDAPPPEGAARPGARLAEAVAARLAAASTEPRTEDAGAVRLVGVECLSNCKAGCTAALAAPGKWSYVLGRLDPDRDAADLLALAALHAAHPAGTPAWRERPEIGRRNVIARLPPLAAPPSPPATEAKDAAE
ncbi:MAG: DUF1636 domain-containing protein [Hyphomicrobiaceae bacterium]